MDSEPLNAPVFVPPEGSGAVVVIPGDLVGEYQIEDQIGEGGMGIVYAGEHPLIGKRVAIKVLKPHAVAQPELVQRFIDEARAVNRIAHPNIIDVFSFGQLADGRHFFVMELLTGESLEERLLRAGTIQFDELVPIMRETADAIDAAHAQGIIHRDLKPGNLFLREGRDGVHVKILDFGIAKLSTVSSFTTQAGVLLGTPLYMSPEQCRGRQVTCQADVYAFAVLIYEALTGQFPLYSSSVPGLIYQHVASVARAPSLFGAPKAFDPVFAKALSKLPEERHATLTNFVEELEAAYATRFDEPLAVATTLSGGDRAARGKAKTAVAGQVAAETQPIPVARPPTSDGSLTMQPPTHCSGHNGGVGWLEFSPDGNLLASAGEDGAVRLWNLSGDPLAALRADGDRPTRLAFSPSSHLVASASNDGSVRVWSIFGGDHVRNYRHKRGVCDLTFTADGTQLISASSDGTLAVCEVSTGALRYLRGHTAAVRAVAVSPDGIIVSGGDDKTIRIWDDRNGRRETRQCGDRVVAIVFAPDGKRVLSAHVDGKAREWRLNEPAAHVYSGPVKSLRTIAYHPNGNLIAAGSSCGKVLLWPRGLARPALLEGHEKRVRHLVFSPKGDRLATISSDCTARVWDLKRRTCQMIISLGGAGRHVVFSPDGQLLATASAAAKITLTPMPRLGRPSRKVQAETAATPVAKHRPATGARVGLILAAMSVAIAGLVAALMWRGML